MTATLTYCIILRGGHSMSFQDKYIRCRDCGDEFVFSASEQQFFAEKGFDNEPKRCPTCRRAKRNRNESSTTSTNSVPRTW